MAQLPPDGTWLMQQHDGRVTLFHRWTEEELTGFFPGDPNSFGPALKAIWESEELGDEAKCFACFWAGYFYSYAVAFQQGDLPGWPKDPVEPVSEPVQKALDTLAPPLDPQGHATTSVSPMIDETPGMWEASDLSGGESDVEVISQPEIRVKAWMLDEHEFVRDEFMSDQCDRCMCGHPRSALLHDVSHKDGAEG